MLHAQGEPSLLKKPAVKGGTQSLFYGARNKIRRGILRSKTFHELGRSDTAEFEADDDPIRQLRQMVSRLSGPQISDQFISLTDRVCRESESMLQASTRSNYSSVWTQFLLWLQHNSAPIPLECKYVQLYTHYNALLGMVSVSQTVCVLHARCDALRGDRSTASFVHGPCSSWLQMRARVARALSGKSSEIAQRKARIIRSVSYYSCDVRRYYALYRFWTCCGLRLCGLIGLVREDCTIDPGGQWVQILCQNSRCSVTNTVDRRYCPKHIYDSISHLLPVQLSKAQHLIWYLNKLFIRENRLADDVHGIDRFSGHSARRTWSCFVRAFLENENINTSRGKLCPLILRRINMIGGWSERSTEWYDYTGDYTTVLHDRNMLDSGILIFIAYGWSGPTAEHIF